MNSDRIDKWRRRATIATTAAGMVYSYGKGFNTFNPEMPPTTRKQSFVAKASGKRKVMRAMKKMVAVNRFKKAGASKAKFVPTHTTGYVGRFKRPKKQLRKKASVFDTQGVVFKNEYSAINTSTECSYVGHGIPLNQVVETAVKALFRTTLIKAGFDIGEWIDTCNFIGKWTLLYTVGESGTVNPITTAFVDTTLYKDIAEQMVQQIRLAISDARTLENLVFQTSRLALNVSDSGSLIYNGIAEVNLKDYKLDFDYWSILKIKNVSLARDSVDGDLSTNVESQPLLGRTYATNKWGNGFVLSGSAANGGFRQIEADVNNGVIDTNAITLGFANDRFNPYRKPPPAYMLGTNKTAVVRINPGELKVDVVKFKASMSWNTWINKVIFNVNINTDTNYRQFGAAHVFAFEREVEIAGDGIPVIRIAYQVDYVMKCRGFALKHKVSPITDTGN